MNEEVFEYNLLSNYLRQTIESACLASLVMVKQLDYFSHPGYIKEIITMIAIVTLVTASTTLSHNNLIRSKICTGN